MPEPVAVTSILKTMVTSPTVNPEALRRAPATGTALQARKKRPFLLDLYSTSVGKKYVMAISGIAMMGFVLFHMIGNLKMYLGAEALDHYAEFLQDLLYPILPNSVHWHFSESWVWHIFTYVWTRFKAFSFLLATYVNQTCNAKCFRNDTGRRVPEYLM